MLPSQAIIETRKLGTHCNRIQQFKTPYYLTLSAVIRHGNTGLDKVKNCAYCFFSNSILTRHTRVHKHCRGSGTPATEWCEGRKVTYGGPNNDVRANMQHWSLKLIVFVLCEGNFSLKRFSQYISEMVQITAWHQTDDNHYPYQWWSI